MAHGSHDTPNQLQHARNKARWVRSDLSGKVDGFDELLKTKSLTDTVGGEDKPSQKSLDLVEELYKHKDPIKNIYPIGIGSVEERAARIKEEYPSLNPAQVEQIAKASNNKRKFAIYLTAYHQIEQIATRDKLISAHNTSIDNQEGITADVKKELKAGASSFAKEQQKKINTGEKTAEEAVEDTKNYLSREYAKAAKFIHQNYLLVNSEKIVQILRKPSVYPSYKKTLVSKVNNSSANPLGIYSSGQQAGSGLLGFNTQQLSSLVPYMKFYKVILEGNRRIKVEIPFPTVSLGYSQTGKIFRQSSEDKGRYFKNRDGFGIKSFEWQYNGTTEATKFTDLSANLSIYFQDFAQLTAIRESGKTKFTYLDLIIPQEAIGIAKTGKSKSVNQTDDAYIVAEAGWSVPPGNSLFTEKDRLAVKENRLSMFLQQKNYELDFDSDTTAGFTLNIEYHSAYELMTKNKNISAILPREKTCELIKQKQDEITAEKGKSNSGDEDRPNRIKKLNDEFEKIKQQAAKESYRYIFDDLLRSNRIHYLKADLGQILNFQGVDEQVVSKIAANNQLNNTQQADLNKDIKAWQDAAADDNNRSEDIYFVFFGDLLESIIMNATNPNKLKKIGFDVNTADTIRIMTTNVGFNGAEINIGDVPIDVRLLANFFFEEVISKKLYTFSLGEFIKSLLTKLMENRVEKYSENYIPSPRVYQTTYINSKSHIVGLQQDAKKLSTAFQNSHTGTSYSYLVIYTVPKDGSEYSLLDPRNYKKSKEYDLAERGIYHFVFGSKNSIVKSSTFKKSDIENLREQRIFETQSPYAILANQFAVDLDMFGNTLFYPGKLIYINPAHSLGGTGRPWEKGSVYNIMGLGGYHQIKTVKSQISDGTFSTQLEVDFISSGNAIKKNKRKSK